MIKNENVIFKIKNFIREWMLKNLDKAILFPFRLLQILFYLGLGTLITKFGEYMGVVLTLVVIIMAIISIYFAQRYVRKQVEDKREHNDKLSCRYHASWTIFLIDCSMDFYYVNEKFHLNAVFFAKSVCDKVNMIHNRLNNILKENPNKDIQIEVQKKLEIIEPLYKGLKDLSEADWRNFEYNMEILIKNTMPKKLQSYKNIIAKKKQLEVDVSTLPQEEYKYYERKKGEIISIIQNNIENPKECIILCKSIEASFDLIKQIRFDEVNNIESQHNIILNFQKDSQTFKKTSRINIYIQELNLLTELLFSLFEKMLPQYIGEGSVAKAKLIQQVKEKIRD